MFDGLIDGDGIVRLSAAAVAGMIIGASRGFLGKPAGMRTMGLVSLGAALITIVTIRMPGIADNPDALSRVLQGVIQGVMAGIGFLGAGVVIRDSKEMEVRGLTTAAAVWITAALGVACALGFWTTVLAGLGITLMLLVVARPLDRWIERRAASRNDYG
ncbi:MgtC/SapB family protein [Methylobrevis sp. L22]|uniref:Protein MgtC n=2 Tax=Methylobrevis albus TaxID=2793297 RepID=A0A931MXE3_9HYPH|nr:MgtC/SapB family protein [Methylobrevis albus]